MFSMIHQITNYLNFLKIKYILQKYLNKNKLTKDSIEIINTLKKHSTYVQRKNTNNVEVYKIDSIYDWQNLNTYVLNKCKFFHFASIIKIKIMH